VLVVVVQQIPMVLILRLVPVVEAKLQQVMVLILPMVLLILVEEVEVVIPLEHKIQEQVVLE
tara:strand:- start:53 stop:238 length:186 start_codon:yes stop_codon:yes gene_type:complete